jgi:hypothetical protein
MPTPEKHPITFDPDAKTEIERRSCLPDLSEVKDEHDETTVYMFFGAAAYYAQFFEESLADFFVMYRKLVNRALLEHEVETLEATLHRQTMGTLLKHLRTQFTIEDTEIDDVLSLALKKRNYLLHNFFRVRVPDFPNPEKRPEIIGELIETGLLLKKAMVTVRGLTAGMKRALRAASEESDPRE